MIFASVWQMSDEIRTVTKLGRKRARLLAQLEQNRDELERAIVAAAVAGESGPTIANAAGVVHQRVYQVLAARGKEMS